MEKKVWQKHEGKRHTKESWRASAITGTWSTSVANFSTLMDGFLDRKPAIAVEYIKTNTNC